MNQLNFQLSQKPESCVGEQTFLQLYLFLFQCSKLFRTTLNSIEQESKQPAILGAWILLVFGSLNVERNALAIKQKWLNSSTTTWCERQESPPYRPLTRNISNQTLNRGRLTTLYVPTIDIVGEDFFIDDESIDPRSIRQQTNSMIRGKSYFEKTKQTKTSFNYLLSGGSKPNNFNKNFNSMWSRNKFIELFAANDVPFRSTTSFNGYLSSYRDVTETNQSPALNYSTPRFENNRRFINQIYRKYRTSYKSTKRTHQWFFSEHREPLHNLSYLILFQWAVGLTIFRIFQALYREHGKEILVFLVDVLVLLGVIGDEEWLKMELGVSTHRDFREARHVKKRFKDLAGIPHWAVGSGEIVWFLRVGKQRMKYFSFFQSSRALKTFLLCGPPGTGKTFLVQSLAGEAEVPILIQSGGVLKSPQQRGYGARTIQNLFRRARKIAPCIVFIDEIDGVGARRENFYAQAREQVDPIDIIETGSVETVKNFNDWHLNAPPPPQQGVDSENELDAFQYGEFLPDQNFYSSAALKVLQENQWEHLARAEQLSILTQLLIELDGLKPLNNLVVIGATNRPQALDPALLRPGRFNQSIETRLPNFQKRIELFCLYTKPLKLIKPLPWAYLARRTVGSSAADIAAIVNEVALKLAHRSWLNILDAFDESVDTIFSYPAMEKAPIKDINTPFRIYSLEKNKTNPRRVQSSPTIFKDPYFKFQPYAEILRIAYYSVGKNFVTSRLLGKIPQALMRVFERPKNFRVKQSLFPNTFPSTLVKRCDLEMDLVSLFSGHAAQAMGFCVPIPLFRPLVRPSRRYSVWVLDQSNGGWVDAQCGGQLIQQMILEWYFYAHQVATEKIHTVVMASNSTELGEDQNRLLEALGENLTQEIYTLNPPRAYRQRWSFRTWWQKNISNQLSLSDRSVLEWYRIYLGDPEETERNIEWVPPDDYYHQSNLDQLGKAIRWNSFLRIGCEYLYRGLVFGALNVAWAQLKLNCECVDMLVDVLIRLECMRDIQFQKILKNFQILTPPINNSKLKTPPGPVVVPSWGTNSRRVYAKKVRLHINREEL